jgi:hypothetical protein
LLHAFDSFQSQSPVSLAKKLLSGLDECEGGDLISITRKNVFVLL